MITLPTTTIGLDYPHLLFRQMHHSEMCGYALTKLPSSYRF